MGESAQKQMASPHSILVLPEDVLNGIGSIERAVVEQTKWFKSWHEQVVCKHDTSRFTVAGIEDIPLGAWYFSVDSHPFRANPGYLLLGDKLREIVQQVQVFLSETDDKTPHSLDDYTSFMNALMDLNAQVHNLQNDAWRGLTRMDPLTGMRNRHEMIKDLDVERERARRTAVPCSIAMVDLDHFKTLNDTHGHVVGDRVLRQVSLIFTEQLRPYDMVYRYGGEEFLLCLPNTRASIAMQVLDRLRNRIAAGQFPYGQDGQGIQVTASFGVVELDGGEHVVKSIERADMALYEAKQGGRNQVKVWTASDAVIR